ncbi:MAG: hypothetical protein IPK13_09915 [Deltaproteobacteria bacterium]|nr:hypothetical protein [Deltaproteobacteria bacterium]
MNKKAAGLVTFFLASLCSAGAIAQSDPFSDYEEGRVDPNTAMPFLEGVPSEDQTSSEALPVLQVQAGKWSVGARGALSWTTGRNEVVDGQRERNTNLFLRFTPTFAFFVWDNVEVAGSLGFLSHSLARPDGIATETDWLLEATGHYYIKLTDRLALAPGLGLGAYLGSSERPVTAVVDGTARTVRESTSTVGGLTAVYGDVIYQLSSNLRLRAGLALTAMFGSESIASSGKSLGSQTVNTGVTLGLFYVF